MQQCNRVQLHTTNSEHIDKNSKLFTKPNEIDFPTKMVDTQTHTHTHTRTHARTHAHKINGSLVDKSNQCGQMH